MNPYLLFAPGPVNLHPKVMKSLSEPMIHHRTPLFDQTLKRVLQRLPSIFGTSQRVYMLSSTGSGGMEALMVNSCSPMDEILVINSGKFGERWVEMGKKYSLKAHELKVEWGQAVSVKDVESILNNQSIKAVFCQACETSTGVAHPIEALGQLIHRFEQTLFMVDGITAVGAYPVPMDEWHIDGLVAGSQKAFMLPTGMSFISFSKKAWNQVVECKTPRFYFDVLEEDKANRKGETWFSSNVSLIRALDVVLDLILDPGLDKHYLEIKERADFTRWGLQKMGFSLFSQFPADSVTAFKVPEGIDSQKLRSDLETQFNITIMGGQDHLKGKILRIGHMGYIQKEDLLRLMLSLQEVFEKNQVSFKTLTESDMREWLKF